jgi:DNA repair exonuclease SbcCD ATPase subunit
MILEGFEIENWSCIKQLAIDGLPATGVVVLHGPNGTGKSSIVAALRACLMDYPATSRDKDLKRWFPKNGAEKSKVSVTFSAQGRSWRITKVFGTKESTLESRVPGGAWKREQSTAAEAHHQTRSLIGDKDSDAGLHQLLWLTQAEFRLPAPKEFDADVQSQLRGVLGILQTPLDDRFLGRVKTAWSQWFSANNKPGKNPKLKKECLLSKALTDLEEQKSELAKMESQFLALEGMLQKSADLEIQRRNLARQLSQSTQLRDQLDEEYKQSLVRLETHQRATERVAEAERALREAQVLRAERADAEKHLVEAEKAAADSRPAVEEVSQSLHHAEQRLGQLRDEVQALADEIRERQARRDEVSKRLQQLAWKEQLKGSRGALQNAERLTEELESVRQQDREHPAPDSATLKKLEENRGKAVKLQADLQAAAISLSLQPDPGAPPPRLGVDGETLAVAESASDGAPIKRAVRRRAEIVLPGWGRIELIRGADARSLDQIEGELADLDRVYQSMLAPFGIGAGDPAPLDLLRQRLAEKNVREPNLIRTQDELRRLAPDGMDRMRQQVARLEQLVASNKSAAASSTAGGDLVEDSATLQALDERLKREIDVDNQNCSKTQAQIKKVEQQIEEVLRRQEAGAKVKLATLNAAAEFARGALERMRKAADLEAAARKAESNLSQARVQLESAKLSDTEISIQERLNAANEGLNALDSRLKAVEKEYHEIKGAMSQTEGLHQKRAAAAARVAQLEHQTEWERLQSESYARLYSLFEECRERQLGAVMGPIHDRVLRWMRVLRIGSYGSISFNDQFLPEKLIAGDGATELALMEESTGTIEQIGLMVRLALGSVLSSAAEPVVAVLDDPLTHSDVVRMDRMRAVLKNATAGDPGLTPPAGLLQIVVFTCHPEWFAVDGAKVVDLSKQEVMSRICPG